MSVTQLANAVRHLPPSEHAAFLDALIAFDREALLRRLEDAEDVAVAREVLATETEWKPWDKVKAELHELHG